MNYLGWMFCVAILFGHIMYTNTANEKISKLGESNQKLVENNESLRAEIESDYHGAYVRGVNDAKLGIMSLNHTNKCKAMQFDVDVITETLIKSNKNSYISSLDGE